MARIVGVSLIIGGLVLSHLPTLFTTPVVYLALDRFRLEARRPAREGRRDWAKVATVPVPVPRPTAPVQR